MRSGAVLTLLLAAACMLAVSSASVEGKRVLLAAVGRSVRLAETCTHAFPSPSSQRQA
jgi:hypothetical protein